MVNAKLHVFTEFYKSTEKGSLEIYVAQNMECVCMAGGGGSWNGTKEGIKSHAEY